MSSSRSFEKQLHQIKTALEKHPDNKRLQESLEKLQTAVNLSTPSLKHVRALPIEKSNDSVLSSIYERKRDYLIEGSHLNQQIVDRYQVGELVFAKNSKENRWYDARVLSIMTSKFDKHKQFTVQFLHDKLAQHCSLSDIRPHSKNSDTIDDNIKNPISALNTPIFPFESDSRKGISHRHFINSTKKPSKSEYIALKEAEHLARQSKWKEFTKRTNSTGQ